MSPFICTLVADGTKYFNFSTAVRNFFSILQPINQYISVPFSHPLTPEKEKKIPSLFYEK